MTPDVDATGSTGKSQNPKQDSGYCDEGTSDSPGKMTEEEFFEFTTYYYRSGDPARAPEALAYFVAPDSLPENIEPMLHVFGRIAECRPDVLRGYEDILDTTSAEGKSFIVTLLKRIGDERTRDILESRIDDQAYSDIRSQIEDAVSFLPAGEKVDPLQREIAGACDLDVLWGEFNATGNKEPIQRIISALEWRDIVREKLSQWLKTEARIRLFGLDRMTKKRCLKRLHIVADIECDFERNEIVTAEDLDCLCMLEKLQVSPNRFPESRKALPFALSNEEVINHMAVKALAKWSLGENALLHTIVLETCEDEIPRVSDRVKLALLEVLANTYGVRGDNAKTVATLREYLRLNHSHTGMKRELQLKESDSEIDQLMELSKESANRVSDARDPARIAHKCAEMTRKASSYVSRLVSRISADEDLQSSDCEVSDWRLQYREPHQFHVNQFMSPSYIDEWMSFGPVTYQNTGFWIQMKGDMHKDLNRRLMTDEWFGLLEAAKPLSAAEYEFSGKNLVLLEYDTKELHGGHLYDLLAENPLINPGNIEIWVRSGTNLLVKAALAFGGRDAEGKKIHGDSQHVFSGYDADIRICRPEDHAVGLKAGDA